MEEKRGQFFLREEEVFVFANEGNVSLPERQHGTVCQLKKGEFGKSEKRMTVRVMGWVIWGKGQKGKGQGCLNPYVQQIRGYLGNSALNSTGHVMHVRKNIV